jgi:hypothetical protein
MTPSIGSASRPKKAAKAKSTANKEAWLELAADWLRLSEDRERLKAK